MRRLSDINPDRFTHREIGRLFFLPPFLSKIMCEIAVIDGDYEKTETGYRLNPNKTDT